MLLYELRQGTGSVGFVSILLVPLFGNDIVSLLNCCMVQALSGLLPLKFLENNSRSMKIEGNFVKIVGWISVPGLQIGVHI